MFKFDIQIQVNVGFVCQLIRPDPSCTHSPHTTPDGPQIKIFFFGFVEWQQDGCVMYINLKTQNTPSVICLL